MLASNTVAALAAGSVLACIVVFRELRSRSSTPRFLLGPSSPSWIYGNSRQITEDPDLTAKWAKQYGRIFRFRGFFERSEIYVSDLAAIRYILDNFPKPPESIEVAKGLVGKGVTAVVGEEHRRQRKIIQHAFAPAQLRLMTDAFLDIAEKLKANWESSLLSAEKTGGAIEVLDGLRRAALDMIGMAGFGYDLDSFNTRADPADLSNIFHELFHGSHSTINAHYRYLCALVPLLRYIPFPIPGSRTHAEARGKLKEIGSEIIKRSRNHPRRESQKDLMSVILRANESEEPGSRLDDEEVLAQIPTFLLAGHHTTSSATGWALHALASHPDIQSRLRSELNSLPTDRPTMEQLNSLPYLDLFLRETLRLYSPPVNLRRRAPHDDVLPLSEPVMDASTGKPHSSLPIAKNQIVYIPILAVNTDPSVWGEDAAEFRPERWTDLPPKAHNVSGVWANMLTFSTGSLSCPGFALSILEQKCLLFVLLRDFEFKSTVQRGGIVSVHTSAVTTYLQQPAVCGEPEAGSQLPLIISPVENKM